MTSEKYLEVTVIWTEYLEYDYLFQLCEPENRVDLPVGFMALQFHFLPEAS